MFVAGRRDQGRPASLFLNLSGNCHQGRKAQNPSAVLDKRLVMLVMRWKTIVRESIYDPFELDRDHVLYARVS